jgi:hypothetical protein
MAPRWLPRSPPAPARLRRILRLPRRCPQLHQP